MSEWQTIESAPNGETVLIWDGENINIAELERGRWRLLANDDFVYEAGSMTPLTSKPTHWRPLPAPPAQLRIRKRTST